MLEQLGEYKVMEKLGEGGMGAVYRGYQKSLDREVALKVLSDRLCADETFVARFQREARAAASLVHPNVIQVFSIGCEQDIHYFAMEYVKGKDLAEHLHEGRKFTLEETLEIMIQVAQAFCCAAEIELIHRDIKPSNIMLDDRGIVKITDFGLAKTTDSNLTEVGSIVGTANYMSPEQSQGMALDYRTDFYSLGVVFYELVTGRPPFTADQPAAVLFKHVYEQPTCPSSINPGLSPSFDKIIGHMMEKKAEDRPSSGEELLNEIRELYNEITGSAQAKSGPMLGSSSSNRMKAVKKSSDNKKASEVAPTIIVPGSGIANKKAIVVDDVNSVRKLLSQILAEKNFMVSEAEDGEIALEKITDEEPDLIILDLGIPKLDGISLLQKLTEKNIKSKIIVLTGKKDDETIQKISELKINAFLSKPVNLHELRDRIDEIMEDEESPISLGPKEEKGSVKKNKKFILVYDTQAYSQHLFRQVLKSEKHNVASIGDGSEAIHILEDGLPNLMVLSAERDSRDAVTLAQSIRKKGWKLPIISIIDEHDETARSQFKELKAEPILVRPIRLDNFKAQVNKCLDNKKNKKSNIKPSGTFETMVHKQDITDSAFSIFDFAKSLIPIVPEVLRKKYEENILEKPKGAVCNTIGGVLKTHAEKYGTEEAMRFIRYAYRKGDFSTRNLCLVLLKEILPKNEEISVLSKIITDHDFRMRIRVLNRIGEMKASSLAGLVVRFLNDDAWKVRNAAMDALEDMGPVISFDPIINFYARSGNEIPDRIRMMLSSSKDPTLIRKMEDMAKNKNPSIRLFMAKLFGEVKSKQLVLVLIGLLKDKHPAVRAAAAESMGMLKSDVTQREPFRAITDSNSAVQEAVIKALSSFKLTKGAKAFLKVLGERKKRVSESAAKLLVQLNSTENSFVDILTKLEKQSTENRKYLSLLLSNIITEEKRLKKIVSDLNSKDNETRIKAASTISSKI